MKITVEKLDDINFILSGSIENSVIESKVAELTAEAEKKTAKAEDAKEEAPSKESIEQEAAAAVFKAFVAEGVKEANIDPDTLLGQPTLKKYEQQDKAVYFEVELSTSPEIDDTVVYTDIIPSFDKPTATKEAVEAKMLEFATKQGTFKSIEKAKPVELDDVAVIDFTGYIDGKEFEGGSAEKFNIKVGSNSFIEGFEEQLLGMEYGETKDVNVSFPKDYSAEDLAGKDAKFVVKLHEIQEQKPATTDDAFAKKILGDEKATLETLKEKFAEQVTSEELSEIYIRDLKPKIVSGLLAKFDFTLPHNIVEQEIDAKVSAKARTFSEEEHKNYKEDKGKFLALRETLRKEAEDTVKLSLIVEALAKKEGVVVNDQEVQAALAYQAMMRGQDAQELVKYYEENNLMNSAKMGLTEDKFFGKLLGLDKS